MTVQELAIDVAVDHRRIEGILSVPDHPRSLVLFGYGNGSGRFSRRDRYVADSLRSAQIATLLVHLLTSDEDAIEAQSGLLRFDVDLLADRIEAITDWVETNELLRTMRLGYFGADTGAAAALIAAARRPSSIGAIVSIGGRPDLAGVALPHLSAPTLFIVGGEDHDAIELNEEALGRISAPQKQLRLIAGATHLLEEAGALRQVAALARDWFETFLEGGPAIHPGAEAR
jgi:putative phosphoribosyl transferase